MNKKLIAAELIKIAKSIIAEEGLEVIEERGNEELVERIQEELNPLDVEDQFSKSEKYQEAFNEWIKSTDDGKGYKVLVRYKNGVEEYFWKLRVDNLRREMGSEQRETGSEQEEEN